MVLRCITVYKFNLNSNKKILTKKRIKNIIFKAIVMSNINRIDY